MEAGGQKASGNIYFTTASIRSSSQRIAAALIALWILWGSMFMALKVAMTTIPPFITGFRFIIAGLVLLLWRLWRSPSEERPVKKQWIVASITGALLIFGGQGGIIAGQLYLSSSITALLISFVPIWITLIQWGIFKKRPSAKSVAGLLLGLSGFLLLLLPSKAHWHINPIGVIFVLLGSLSWAIGSVYSRNSNQPKQILTGAAIQMLVGGLLILLVGLATGEFTQLKFSSISFASIISFIYLTFVTLSGFILFSWLLHVGTPSLPNTFAYVSPVVAVVLGWVFLDEQLTFQMIAASLIILSGVILIVLSAAKSNTK